MSNGEIGDKAYRSRRQAHLPVPEDSVKAVIRLLVAGGPRYNRNAEALRARTAAAGVRRWPASWLLGGGTRRPVVFFFRWLLFTAKRLYSAAQGRRVSRRTLGYRFPSVRYAEGVSQRDTIDATIPCSALDERYVWD